MRCSKHVLWLIPVAVVLLTAAEPWISKPTAQWNEDDAKQVLTASPWVKVVTAGIARPLSEDELRAGGEMGEHHGVGYDGVEGNKPQNAKLPPTLKDMLITGKNQPPTRFKPGIATVQLRWESALPVRLAELKAHEVEPPTLDGEGYKIAV